MFVPNINKHSVVHVFQIHLTRHPADQILLSHISLELFWWGIGKQRRPRSDATWSPLFAHRIFYWYLNKNLNTTLCWFEKEDRNPSRHDCKIVDCDVSHQHKQNIQNILINTFLNNQNTYIISIYYQLARERQTDRQTD